MSNVFVLCGAYAEIGLRLLRAYEDAGTGREALSLLEKHGDTDVQYSLVEVELVEKPRKKRRDAPPAL